MSVFEPQVTASPEILGCCGKLSVTVSFRVGTDLCRTSTDMVLVLDRSGSMCGEPMARMKEAAECLIRQVAWATGDREGRCLKGDSRMALVSFAEEAVTEVPLTQDVEALTAAAADLSCGGDTNHEKAFRKAESLLRRSKARRKLVILFTDGVSNQGRPETAAAELRAQGVEIYCIGLLSRACLLYPWASQPWKTHVAVTRDPCKLQKLFCQIAAQAMTTGVREAVIRGCLRPEFRICRIDSPSQGRAERSCDRCFTWNVGSVTESGTLSLHLDAMLRAGKSGILDLFECLSYEDRDGNCLCFPNPQITVECEEGGTVVEPCPPPLPVEAEGCQDLVVTDPGEIQLTGLGRIVEVNAVVKQVCPGKRVAVAVILTERDCMGREYARGSKTVLIPPQTGEGCRDVALQCIRFVVPEVLSTQGCGDSLCGTRRFSVRMFANYVDTDFQCCDPEPVIL